MALLLAGCAGAGTDPADFQGVEQPTKIRIDGIVEDRKSGEPLAKVHVTLTTNMGFHGTFMTGDDGLFFFVLEPAALCRVELTRTGYHDKVLTGECGGGGDVSVSMESKSRSSGPPPSDPPPSDPPPTTPPADDPPEENGTPETPRSPIPHVLVAVPDTGVNPYHEIYSRPELTEHPCTYIPDFPCDVPALNLTLDASSFEEAFQRDRYKWEAIEPGDMYWIPRTAFVAVICEEPYEENDPVSPATGDICILDDSHFHGTATTSSILTENPDALIAFAEGRSSLDPFRAAGLPVDVYSVSWGNIVPFPTPNGVFCPNFETAPIYVVAAGNDPRSTVIDCWKGHPNSIAVGGAFAEGNSDHPLPAKQPDVVSYFCRPTAKTKALEGWDTTHCGTSLSAPTVAGGLSRVILELRSASGYTGSLQGDFVDPLQGVTISDLRDAMNRTASYDPEPQYPNGPGTPRVDEAPWIQWGWGFYDGLVSNATIDHMLGRAAADPKPAEAVLYMETVYLARQTLYG